MTSPYVHSRVDFNIFTMGNPMQESTLTLPCQSRTYPYARVDFIPQSGTLDLASGSINSDLSSAVGKNT
jgi:hypothetical protein